MIPVCILSIENEEDRLYFTDLFYTYHCLICHEALRILHDDWDAEDVLQITIERLIPKIDLLRSLGKPQLTNYIISSTKHNALNLLRSKRSGRVFRFDEYIDSDFEDIKNDRDAMERRIIEEENRVRFIKAWPQMDEKTRYILEAKYILEKSDTEMADDLGIKPESVRMALTRARKEAFRLISDESIPTC